MSTRNIIGSNVQSRRLSSSVPQRIVTTPWVRNPSWLPLPIVGDTEQAFKGLIAIFPESSFTAFTAAAAYTVDWGDGTTNNYTTGATALKLYDYNDVNLANTDAPVTLTDSGDLIQRTAHGYTNGMKISFYNIVTTTGLTVGQVYYVINANANDFQVSDTVGGTAIVLTGDGSASLLPYKQAIVTVTPQAGENFTALNLNVRHTQAGLQAYETGWLDIEVGSPNFSASGLTLGGITETVRKNMIERARIVNTGNITSMASQFQNMRSLQSVPLFNTAAVTNMSLMFLGCPSLQSVPLFNTAAVTNMDRMFFGCNSLQSVPLFNTAAVTNMNRMFNDCFILQSVPLFDTAAVTTMSQMFQGCSSLQSVPLFDTAAVTSMSSMFNGCNSLQSVPLFNTAAVTSMSLMFNGCRSLQSVPLFNTAAVTNMGNMFFACLILQSVPLFNTAAVTNMSRMFDACNSLQSVPLFNTAAVTNMSSMFNGCFSLQSIPALNTSAVSSAANFANMFLNCNSISRIQASNFNFTFSIANCKLSGTALDEIYTNLPTVPGQTITVTGNYGTATHDPTIATAKGWTVTV
jgi:surface protein